MMKISAKTLGALGMPSFCPRCFWLQMHYRLPYQIFPGIFSTIDSYTKTLVHSYMDAHGSAPPWLSPLGAVKSYVKPPHYSSFQAREGDITLQGEADGIFRMEDGSHIIVDYKTSKHTEAQDDLYPIYHIQLNAYAYIGERNGLKPVSALALVYFEPMKDLEGLSLDAHIRDTGFVLPFRTKIVPVKVDAEATIPALLHKAKAIYDEKEAPECKEGCKDCELMGKVVEGYN